MGLYDESVRTLAREIALAALAVARDDVSVDELERRLYDPVYQSRKTAPARHPHERQFVTYRRIWRRRVIASIPDDSFKIVHNVGDQFERMTKLRQQMLHSGEVPCAGLMLACYDECNLLAAHVRLRKERLQLTQEELLRALSYTYCIQYAAMWKYYFQERCQKHKHLQTLFKAVWDLWLSLYTGTRGPKGQPPHGSIFPVPGHKPPENKRSTDLQRRAREATFGVLLQAAIEAPTDKTARHFRQCCDWWLTHVITKRVTTERPDWLQCTYRLFTSVGEALATTRHDKAILQDLVRVWCQELRDGGGPLMEDYLRADPRSRCRHLGDRLGALLRHAQPVAGAGAASPRLVAIGNILRGLEKEYFSDVVQP